MRTISILLLIALCGCSAAAASSQIKDPPPVHVRHFDVVIYGGSPAGIAAALSAARRGLTVALVSQESELGGDLTLGGLNQWDLNQSPDGAVIQRGIFEQFYSRLPNGFEPSAAARYFEQIVTGDPRIAWFKSIGPFQTVESGTNSLQDVTALQFRTTHGLMQLQARFFVDSSDSGELAVAAGARSDLGRQDEGHDDLMQPATLIFTLGGVDWNRLEGTYSTERYGYGGSDSRQAYGYAKIVKTYQPLNERALVPDANFQRQEDGAVMVNAIDILGVDGRSQPSIDEGEVIARAESRHFTAFLRDTVPGFEHAYVRSFATAMYIRETRHVLGYTIVTPKYIWNETVPYDTIGLASFPLDVHPVERGEPGGAGWAEVPHVYGIPLRSLLVRGFTNLAIIGPSVSATHIAAGSLRVIPTTVVEGEGIGAACSIALQNDVTLRALAESPQLMDDLRDDLAGNGADVGTVREVERTADTRR